MQTKRIQDSREWQIPTPLDSLSNSTSSSFSSSSSSSYNYNSKRHPCTFSSSFSSSSTYGSTSSSIHYLFFLFRFAFFNILRTLHYIIKPIIHFVYLPPVLHLFLSKMRLLSTWAVYHHFFFFWHDTAFFIRTRHFFLICKQKCDPNKHSIPLLFYSFPL